MNNRSRRELIQVARGERPAEWVLKNGRVIDVFSATIQEMDVALHGGRIAGLGSYRGTTEIDLKGRYLAPGFIDGHVHVESSKVLVAEYARCVVPRGTAAIVMDPHEIANVMGIEGVRYLLESGRDLPMTVYCMVPSCVPSGRMETSGARLDAAEVAELLREEGVLGLAEMMDYPGLLAGEEEVLEKLRVAWGKKIDGHAPGLTGRDLCAYVAAGMGSDHECTGAEEVEEKLRLGMYIMVREGSAAHNLEEIITAVTPGNSHRFLFATDDRSPEDLVAEGHIDHLIRKAVRLGLDPLVAIRMATAGPAAYFGLDHLGAVAPGRRADLVVLDELDSLRVVQVFHGGTPVAENGQLTVELLDASLPAPSVSMNVDWTALEKLRVEARGNRLRVIELIPGQILNRSRVQPAKVENDCVVPDLERDILKLAVLERHSGSGRLGVGFVAGFGLKEGALASSVAHDAHNIVVVGTTDEEMEAAARQVAKLRGGQVVIRDGKVVAALPLRLAGLISHQPMGQVVEQARALSRAAGMLGCRLEDPFMTLSFLALPVLPELRVTDGGLVDVARSRYVSPFVTETPERD